MRDEQIDLMSSMTPMHREIGSLTATSPIPVTSGSKTSRSRTSSSQYINQTTSVPYVPHPSSLPSY
jgi:hypothetical protein